MVRMFVARDVRRAMRASCGAGRFGFEEGAQFAGERGVVGEGIFFGVRFEEEIERIEDRHLGDQIDFDEEFGGGFGEDQAREIVALRVLLPVEEVVLRAGSSANRRGSACGSAAPAAAGRSGDRERCGGRSGNAFCDSARREWP